jgi:hypothetical protein
VVILVTTVTVVVTTVTVVRERVVTARVVLIITLILHLTSLMQAAVVNKKMERIIVVLTVIPIVRLALVHMNVIIMPHKILVTISGLRMVVRKSPIIRRNLKKEMIALMMIIASINVMIAAAIMKFMFAVISVIRKMP